MQNINHNQLKRSVILSPDEFEYVIKEATGKNIVPQLDMDGIWFDYDEDKEFIDNVDDYVKDCLSKYFEINITSIHIDDCDLSGVWLTFDKDLSPEKNIQEENEQIENDFEM